METPLRILFIDDCENDVALLLRELRQGGYDPVFERVETAPALKAALARQTWDVALADYRLPQFSGPAALAMVREQQSDVPLIVVSGAIGEETAVAMLQAGADDYLLKDNLARLVPAIKRSLREANERRARRQAERHLQESERRFRSLIENASGMIAVVHPNGAIGYVSPPVERILGYRQEELIGRNLAEYVVPEDGHLLATFLSEMLRQPQTLVPVELHCRHQDQSRRILGVMGQNLLDDPLLQGIILNAQDITQRRQLEEQLRQSQKMDAIGRLAGGVAHDFNNMLGVITGYSDLLLHRVGGDENTRACLGEIMKAAERAAGLTRQLLLFSRQEVQSRQVLDLGEVAANMHQMLRRLIDADIELVTLLDPAAGAVNADPGQMEQVLLNLAVNARDAMPQGGKLTIATKNVHLEAGGGRVAAREHPGVPPGAYVLLSVSDTGCGMEEITQARIFEPFFTTKEAGKGTGLGLATVYGIVQQHEGHLRVESQLGQGTTFHLYLPRTDPVSRSEALPAAAAPPPPGSETILLVEDEPIVRGLVQEILRLNGYGVLAALQGDEALRLCEQHENIDLLLTDVVMPGMGGRELAERAVALRPTLKVLFMSGYTDDAVVRHGVYTAEIAFIQKPFKPAALAQKVRAVLETS